MHGVYAGGEVDQYPKYPHSYNDGGKYQPGSMNTQTRENANLSGHKSPEIP